MLKSVSICAALILAAAVFANSAEARPAALVVVAAWVDFVVLAWAGVAVLAWAALILVVLAPWTLPVREEWDSPVQAGSLVLHWAELLGQAEVIGPATGGLAIGAEAIFAVDVFGPGA